MKLYLFALLTIGSLAYAAEKNWVLEEFPLHYAAGKGDSKKVKELIESGLDINNAEITVFHKPNDQGYGTSVLYGKTTALHWAAWGCHCNTMELLLKAGAKVDLSAQNGETPLIFAARRCGPEPIKLLLKYKANINHQGNYSTPFWQAVNSCNYRAMKTLKDNGANIHQKQYKDRYGADRFNVPSDEFRMPSEKVKGCEKFMNFRDFAAAMALFDR